MDHRIHILETIRGIWFAYRKYATQIVSIGSGNDLMYRHIMYPYYTYRNIHDNWTSLMYMNQEHLGKKKKRNLSTAMNRPWCSMHEKFTYMYPNNDPNVAWYSIHGASGRYSCICFVSLQVGQGQRMVEIKKYLGFTKTWGSWRRVGTLPTKKPWAFELKMVKQT